MSTASGYETNCIFESCKAKISFPDQDGRLRKIPDISYPPRELTRDGQIAWDSLDRWAAYAGRPAGWLHHTTLNRNRLATLERVIGKPLSRAAISDWLKALVENATEEAHARQASTAAIQTAALIPESIRGNHNSLGSIVLTAAGTWVVPNPDTVFLGGDNTSTASNLVHPQLQAEPETLDSLNKLGIKPASAESAFREYASGLWGIPWYERRVASNEEWLEFWRLARYVDQKEAAKIINESTYRWENWRDKLCVRTISGKWRSLFQTLLPGPIVPADGSRDSDVSIDLQYHEAGMPLLTQLGAVDSPRAAHELSHAGSRQFTNRCKTVFQEHAQNVIGSRPQNDLLVFEKPVTGGPLDLLELLSEEAKVKYTWELLALDDTYKRWTMRHTSRDIYPRMAFVSPAIQVLRQHGRVETGNGICPLSDGLGSPPRRLDVLFKLLSHPKAAWIREVFELQAEIDAQAEPIGADAPVPLVDVWPGLKTHLSKERANIELVHCDGFQQMDGVHGYDERDCIIIDGTVYVTRKGDERDEITAILRALGLQLDREQIERVLLGLTDADVQAARDAVREWATDAERLLAAVGEFELRRRLPSTLITILRTESEPCSGYSGGNGGDRHVSHWCTS